MQKEECKRRNAKGGITTITISPSHKRGGKLKLNQKQVHIQKVESMNEYLAFY